MRTVISILLFALAFCLIFGQGGCMKGKVTTPEGVELSKAFKQSFIFLSGSKTFYDKSLTIAGELYKEGKIKDSKTLIAVMYYLGDF